MLALRGDLIAVGGFLDVDCKLLVGSMGVSKSPLQPRASELGPEDVTNLVCSMPRSDDILPTFCWRNSAAVGANMKGCNVSQVGGESSPLDYGSKCVAQYSRRARLLRKQLQAE